MRMRFVWTVVPLMCLWALITLGYYYFARSESSGAVSLAEVVQAGANLLVPVVAAFTAYALLLQNESNGVAARAANENRRMTLLQLKVQALISLAEDDRRILDSMSSKPREERTAESHRIFMSVQRRQKETMDELRTLARSDLRLKLLETEENA